MAGGKETPRQKMIGMMYLVLTALLALNVQKEVLDAFVIVDESIVETNKNFAKKNEILYSAFEKALADDEKKTRPYYEKAEKAKKLSEELIKEINDVRARLLVEVEGVEKEVADTMPSMYITKKDNYDIPTHFMCGTAQDATNGEANKLKEKIIKFKEDMLNLLDEEDQAEMKIGLNVENSYNASLEKEATWEYNNFYHTVSVATVVILNKLIAEVKNAEADIVSKLLESISAGDFKFDKIDSKVVPNSKIILQGEKYIADIFVAAYSTTQTPEVVLGDWDSASQSFIGDTTMIFGKDGVVRLERTGAGTGENEIEGVINVMTPTGEKKPYPFKTSYTVVPPTATVSADKMNVFYIGLENPVSISVPGVSSDKIRPGISSGSIRSAGGAGKYTVTVPTGVREVNVSVSAEMGGSMRSMGSFPFRVKKVPDPVPMVANQKGGTIGKGLLTAAPIVEARLENFLFDGVNYSVTSFKFSMIVNGLIQERQISGYRLDQNAINMIKNARSNEKVYFEDIKAKGPDGTTRSIGNVILRIL